MFKKFTPLQKRIAIIGVSIIAVGLIAAGIITALHMTSNDQPANDDGTAQREAKKAEGNAKREEGVKALDTNDNETALAAFREARELYVAAQEGTEYGETNPSPEVVDMDLQINLVENAVVPVPEPQTAPEDFPKTEQY